MIIPARPYPDIKALVSKDSLSNIHDLHFFPLGRDALLFSLIALGLKKGDGVIVPAYMCNSTIQPLQEHGFKLIFIDIDKSLKLPIDIIKKLIAKDDTIKALLEVHYFGLTKNMDEVIDVCQECGIKVVEDASHSFMSQFLRNKDSIKSDAEIFSMRKSFPIVDGGALRINNGSYDVAKNQCMPIINDVKYLILRFLEKVVMEFGVNIYSRFINNIKTKLRSKETHEIYDFNAKTCQASWQLRKYLGNEKYLQDTQQIIVNNFNQLSQALQDLGFRLLVESVEDNIIPQACIVYDDKGGLVDYLRSKGVGVWNWPDKDMPYNVCNNPKHYPCSVYMNTKLVLFPIHQRIEERHIQYMISTLRQWLTISVKND
jgi:dTDP-4-amino-4,6-dideoxygalactose transaminase